MAAKEHKRIRAAERAYPRYAYQHDMERVAFMWGYVQGYIACQRDARAKAKRAGKKSTKKART